MMELIQETINSHLFQPNQRRNNVFLTYPEIMNMFDFIATHPVNGSAIWWSAFVEMVRDFEILTDLPKDKFNATVRKTFDRWSEGNGMMPGSETTNAILEITGGGAWLQAMQRLCMKTRICGLYADGDSREELKYPNFKTHWIAAAGSKGFVEKTKIKKFVSELLFEKDGTTNLGMWYEAFLIALERLRMDVKTSTALSLYLAVDKGMDGFLNLEDFSELIKYICECGIWEQAYIDFLEANKVDLPVQVRTKFWGYLNEESDNPGLVPIDKVCERLERMIMNTGMLQSVLFTVCSLLDINVPEVELIFIHKQLDANQSGFIDYRTIFQLLDKIGRRGMPFSRFKMWVKKMEMRFRDDELYDVFATLDVNQDGMMSLSEFMGGLAILVKQRLPQTILVKLGMTKMQMISAVLVVVGGMGLLFAFLLLGLNSFGGGRATIAKIQSSFSMAITYGGGSAGGDVDAEGMTNRVKSMIALAMGVTLKD
jgi:Ca2+-binding EF-hand superfamily protein